MNITKSTAGYDLQTGTLRGAGVTSSQQKLCRLEGYFQDEKSFAAMDGEEVIYEVSSHAAVEDSASGGLLLGTSCVHPGRVGNEYYMTKGHFHAKREACEYYWGISGTGVLLLMDENGACTAEWVEKGSLHLIGGHIAHRLVNTGDKDLVVGACWPSDAGHDYGSIATQGFSVRVFCRDGKPVLVASPPPEE